MIDKTITLRSDLVDRLETLAQVQGRTPDDVLDDLLEQYPLPANNNWALVLAEGMKAVDIDWHDDPDASEHSSEHFERHLHEKWQRTQNPDAE